MAVRNDFAAGEVLAAADLNDTFASKLPYSYGTATPSTTDSGFLWYDSNSTPAAPKFWDGAAFQALTSGKILQVVRATGSATRITTTSTSFVDVTDLSVTITPTKNDSALLLIATFYQQANGGSYSIGELQIADSSNNGISGANVVSSGGTGAQTDNAVTLIAYATPATTSSVTYKVRHRRGDATSTEVRGDLNTSQIFAIEVGA